VGRFKFTDAALRRRFAENPRGLAWDADCRPLCAARNGNGSISLTACYRLVNDKVKKKTLEHLSEVPLTQFRAQALELAMAARNGKDLVAERKVAAAPQLTLGDCYVAYCEALKRKGASPNTLRLNQKNWALRLSKHQNRELASITRAKVRGWHGLWGKDGHATASNQTIRLCRTLLNFAKKRLDCELTTNVCEAVELFQERGQRRVVSSTDLAAWHAAVRRIENPIKRCYWLGLLLTGVRREELASLRWEHVLEDRIKIVRPKGGERRAFEVALTPQLRAVLEEAREAGAVMFPQSAWVFPAASKTGYILNPLDPNLPNCSPHDLRRTFCSIATECGVDPYTLKFLVNHATNGSSDVTARYVIPSFEHRAMAARKVAAHIAEKCCFRTNG
jgi:integrase